MTHTTGAREQWIAGTRTAMRRTWAEINLDAVAHNLRTLRALLTPSCQIMAVVKADAYGHGAIEVSRMALEAGATWLGVATVEEGIAVRRAGIGTPVLILGALHPDDIPLALAQQLRVTISSLEMLDALAGSITSSPPAGAHLKIDTGMMRLGVLPSDVPRVLDRLMQLRVPLEGCYTHLACADDPDPSFTKEQLARFRSILPEVKRAYPDVIIHTANSAAALADPQTHDDLVRIGLALYGIYPADHLRNRVSLRPAMALKSRVVRTAQASVGSTVSYGATYRVRAPTAIATIACGYADGYPRLAGDQGEVVIRGRRHRIAGSVCMDYLMVDIGDHPARVGDEVILFDDVVSVDEVAAWARTIPYEILCGVGLRVPRIYLRGGRPVAASEASREQGNAGTPREE